MGKRKRSKERKRLREEVKRLRRELKGRSRRESASSCSSRSHSYSSENDEPGSRDRSNTPAPVVESDIVDMDVIPSPMRADDETELIETNKLNGVNELDINKTEPDLPPEVLEILGDDPTKDNKCGENLHKELLPRWKHILANGLDKDGTIRKDLCNQYNIPENCDTLRAPRLNPQVSKLLNNINNKKELFNENKQNQLASCLAALAKALNIVLSNKENLPKGILKPLSDAGRILCDLHYRESLSRRHAIINIINKDMRDTLKKTKIDEFLFGTDLAEHLKLDREITRVAGDLRISRPPYRPPAVPGPSRGALNYRGMRGVAAPSVPRQYPQQRQPAARAPTTSYQAPRGRDRDYRRFDSESSRRNSGRGRTLRR